MKKLSGIAAISLIIATLVLGSTDSLSQESCDSSGNHTIQVRPGEDGVPALKYRGRSADEVHVCIGDEVRWVLTGPDREFFIDFFSGGPFEGATRHGSNGNVVSIVVGDSAERGRGYEYDVEFAEGQALDPRIVVD